MKTHSLKEKLAEIIGVEEDAVSSIGLDAEMLQPLFNKVASSEKWDCIARFSLVAAAVSVVGIISDPAIMNLMFPVAVCSLGAFGGANYKKDKIINEIREDVKPFMSRQV